MTDLPRSPILAHQQGYNEGYEAARKQLRDELAGRVMQGIITHYGTFDNQIDAARSYRIADAMLKARQGDE